MGHWWERDWLHRHAIIAPFGVFTATMLLTWYLERWQWQGRASWEQATEQVDLGAVIYAMVAVLAEQGVNMVFWALQKRRERQEKLRAEGRAEVKKQYEERLARVAEEAREKGITLESLREPTMEGSG